MECKLPIRTSKAELKLDLPTSKYNYAFWYKKDYFKTKDYSKKLFNRICKPS